MKTTSIMIIDGNADYSNALRHAFQDRGYMTWICPGLETAVSVFEAAQPNVVLLDLDLGDSAILELLDTWQKSSPATRLVVAMAVPNVHRLREAMDHGAHAFIVKSHSLAPLFDLLEKEIPPVPPSRIEIIRSAAA